MYFYYGLVCGRTENGKVHLNTMDAGRRCGKVELIYESKYNGIKNVVI